MSGSDLTNAPETASVSDAGDGALPSLLDSAPEIAPSPETFERLYQLRAYRGPVRTECDDQTWDAVRSATKSLVPHVDTSDDGYDELPIWVAEALLSLKHSRPVEQLLLDLCVATDTDSACLWWAEHNDDKPTTDFRSVIKLAYDHGWDAAQAVDKDDSRLRERDLAAVARVMAMSPAQYRAEKVMERAIEAPAQDRVAQLVAVRDEVRKLDPGSDDLFESFVTTAQILLEPEFEPCPGGLDISDDVLNQHSRRVTEPWRKALWVTWRRGGSSPLRPWSTLDVLSPEASVTETTSKFTPRVPDLDSPRPNWIIKGVLQEKSLAMLFGKWGTGKSSLAVDMGVAIARGASWHGRRVKQGKVVYIASENAHGFRARLDAALRDQRITLDDLGDRFLEITGRPHLLRPDDVKELITELKTLGQISCIVVDTFSRATAGADENAVKETMIAVENTQTIMNETGAAVLLVHHVGKDSSRGARGSSALPAAADTEIVLERPDETANFRTARLGKQRDAADYTDLFDFELKVFELGTDEDGEKITTTVVREVDPPPKRTMTVVELKNTPIRLAIRGVLGNAQRSMPFEELITSAVASLAPPEPGREDNRRKRIRQAYERMVADRELHVGERGMVSLMTPGTPFTPVPTEADGDLVAGGVS